MNNNIRFDLSNYLIHFFRDIDLESSSGINFPEHMGWQNLYEDTSFPAFFMLRAALRNGRLWATWSIRNNVRTIYGPDPAICFTDMPIAAFLEAGFSRWTNGEAMSQFAFVFPKEHLFQSGARPVISGLSTNVNAHATTDVFGNRVFAENILPQVEQYRYVSYAIGGQRNIDWTHEREWRLPLRTNQSYDNDISDWSDIPGLDIYKFCLEGLGVIVKTQKQADLVISDMLTLVDNNTAELETFGFVLVSDLLPKLYELREPANITAKINSAMITLAPYITISNDVCQNYSETFSNLVQQVLSAYKKTNYCASPKGCWLWLHDNMSQLTRALLRTNRVFVTSEGRYLASLPEFGNSREIGDLEEMTTQLEALVRKTFNIDCCYFSVVGSNNPSDVPFYAGEHDNDISFYNCSWGS
jgi:hypothetical protein